MATMCEIELWACVDSDGDYAVGKDADAAKEAYEEEYGALNERDGFRLVCVKANVPLPQAIEITVNVPEEPEPTVNVA